MHKTNASNDKNFETLLTILEKDKLDLAADKKSDLESYLVFIHF